MVLFLAKNAQKSISELVCYHDATSMIGFSTILCVSDDCFAQSVHNFKAVFLINRTTLWQELMMHHANAHIPAFFSTSSETSSLVSPTAPVSNFLLSSQSQQNACLSSVSSVLGRGKKSAGAQSGEYGGWGMIMVFFLAESSRTKIDKWAGMLSWCNIHDWLFHNSVRFWRVASHNRRITSRQYSLLIVRPCGNLFRFILYLVNRSKMLAFHRCLQFWKEEKAKGGQVRWIRWLKHDYGFFFFFLVKNSRTSIVVWAGGLSWWKVHDWFFRNSVHFWRIASRNRRMTSR